MLRNIWLAVAATAAIIGALAFYLAMPVASSADSRAMRLPIDPVPLVVSTSTGQRSFAIEIADDVSERARGLMFRETMADGHGMLFVFEQTQPVGFWMKDTPMPLDLLFIGEDGSIRDILPGEPFSTAPISPREPVRFVLELKRGTAAKAGIGRGDMLSHPAIGLSPRPAGCRRTARCRPAGDAERRRGTANVVSILKGIAGAMKFFTHDGFELAFVDLDPTEGADPVLLIHGFASNSCRQLGGPWMGADTQRCRLSGNRARQSRPWRVGQKP